VTRLVDKVLRGSPLRPTRLHSMRGELLPWSEWPAAGRSIASRALRRSPEGPWITPSAVRRLDHLLRPSMTLLELGSGASTSWYARRVAHVTSIEPDPAWAEAVRTSVAAAGLADKVEVRLSAIAACLASAAEEFDVVVVDFNPVPDRPDAVRAVASFTRQLIVHDDSDAPFNRIEVTELPGQWRAERHAGMKPTPLAVVETSLYLRT
jgi:hypothetical protein